MINFKIASIRKNTIKVPTSSFFIKETDSKLKNWFSKKAFNILLKWKYLNPYFDDQIIETFHYDESKSETITKKIANALVNYEYNYSNRITPETYVIVAGESTFFELLNEKRNSPFFNDTYTFMSNDIYYNDPYHGRRAMNFAVHVVPGMEGFAFVPKVAIERKV
jgi:hypothetical protein